MFKPIAIAIFSICLFQGCSKSENRSPMKDNVATTSAESPKIDPAKIITGNGKKNYIILEDAKQDGAILTFKKVAITKPGFLVLHPFKAGKPVQTEYVGVQPLPAGEHFDVSIEVDNVPQSNDMFIVMLHYDVNEDGIFDFNDGVTVPDAPVFEGHTLVALRHQIP